MLGGKPVIGILGIPVMEHMQMIINIKRGYIYLPKKKNSGTPK
jgi:hypothetical protein